MNLALCKFFNYISLKNSLSLLINRKRYLNKMEGKEMTYETVLPIWNALRNRFVDKVTEKLKSLF